MKVNSRERNQNTTPKANTAKIDDTVCLNTNWEQV